MFKKFVSNLPFSPALVGQLGFYAKRLRREEATRRLGLLFVVLAVILQSFAIFEPPQQALATSPNDMVSGGIQSKEQLLQAYDQAADFATLANYLGITRDSLAAASDQAQKRCSTDESLIIFGRQPLFSAAQGEVTYQVPSTNQTLTFYARPLHTFDKQKPVCHQVFAGSSNAAGEFAIAKDSGNIIIANPQPNTPNAVVPSLNKSKTARSLTYNTDITKDYVVKAAERVEYTLTTTNTGSSPVTQDIVEPLADTLEYATLRENGGAVFAEDSKTLTWPNMTLAPGATDIRKVVVEINSVIADTPYSASNPSSFDCVITNIYGNTLDIKVDCPNAKVVENTVQNLPTTGPGANIAFGVVVLGIATYLYARNRQLSREIKLVRHEFSTGTP